MEGHTTPPLRQNSAVSAASSGERTVRAVSASSSASNHNDIFFRLTGRVRDKTVEYQGSDEDESFEADTLAERSSNPIHLSGRASDGANGVKSGRDAEDAGPSDYYRRSPSPISQDDWSTSDTPHPPTDWKKLSHQPFHADDPESGPSDYWQRPPDLMPGQPSSPRHPDDTSVSSQGVPEGDSEEYQRRLRGIPSPLIPHHRPQMTEAAIKPLSEEGYFDLRSRGTPNSDMIYDKHGYDSAYRQVIGDEEQSDRIGEEEFGSFDFPVKDDASDKTPSPSSLSVSGSASNRRTVSARAPGVYPQNKAISRLRSHLRNTSSATQHTVSSQPGPPGLSHVRSASHFSQISRSESMSTMSGAERIKSPPFETSTLKPELSPAFNFHPLRHLSAHLFSKDTSGTASPVEAPSRRVNSSSTLSTTARAHALGRPTVMDVRGMIAVGTETGWVAVYNFSQELKYVLGNDSTASSPVTAVTICADQTYIAVGHSSGDIHLYDLSSQPNKPSRTTLALPLSQILSGRKEGHLQNSRILHIGFVGARHTSIVSGDEHGRAFWWSLGKVIGVESNDVVRMLGSYPDKTSKDPSLASKPTKRQTTLFAVSPLPLGESSHPTDAFTFTALLTPVKLVIVAMKPSAKTWFRKMRESGGGTEGGLLGCATWLRSGELAGSPASDPVLAYTWGNAVSFLRIKIGLAGPKDLGTPEFANGRKWEAPHPVKALQWYDANHVLLITTSSAILLDVRSMRAVEDTPLQTKLLTAHDYYSTLQNGLTSIGGSVKTYRGKLFLLVGTLLHWNDQVLSKVHKGDFLGAIQLALAYYQNRAVGNLINLPDDPPARLDVIGARVRDLMRASLDWAFSEERMKDDTHFSPNGRGVDLTSLFEGLATTCIQACLAMQDQALLYDDVYEHFNNAGIQAILLSHLESGLFDGTLVDIPANIVQALIKMHDDRGEFSSAEAVIWHVDPAVLDINQAINICERHSLWDALIHVYTRALKDYVAPIVKLLELVGDVQKRRRERPSLVGESGVVENAPDAYRLYAYLENILSGLSYPSGEPLPVYEGFTARSDTYDFVFHGSPVAWPCGGDLVLTDEDVAYPYLHLLLRFDTEALLHVMDIAFEDPYLNDTAAAISRQSIVNLMLEIVNETFSTSDITFLHIFVARNLPKYPQFLFIPPSTLHRILISLADDPDQSTREDRQLAAEFLLSAYTPHDSDAMMARFETAGFFRILRSTYRKEEKWSPLISTYLNDPDTNDEVFAVLDEILQSSRSPEVVQTMSAALPHLFDLSVRQTALLLDKDLPSLHPEAIKSLADTVHKQMVYLKCLLDPSVDFDDMGALPISKSPSPNLDIDARHLYINLLCQQDPTALLSFLDARGSSFFDLERLSNDCRAQGVVEGQLWALDRQGKTSETFETVYDTLSALGPDLGHALVNDDEGGIHSSLQTIDAVAKMAVRLCHEHSMASDVEDMWFGVLNQLVQLNNSTVALVTSANPIALETLRGLIQSTLSSLVSSSSSSALSFPRLFKRLVESSTSTNKVVKKGRAYSEFRMILMGMLDSYKAEGDMLSMSIRLIEADLFRDVEELTMKRMRGWRPTIFGICTSCGGRLPPDQSMMVLGSGEVRHETCPQ